MTRLNHSTLPRTVPSKFGVEPVRQLLSKSMEKTFRRMLSRPSARRAYVEAEVVTALAHQVRAIRMQRGWTQMQLAKRLGTTQAAVSRLEDSSYGRATVKTLLELAAVFDSGIEVKFVSLVTMLSNTFIPNAKAREVASFEEEAPHVAFFSQTSAASDFLTTPASQSGRVVTVAVPSVLANSYRELVTIPTVTTISNPTMELA